MTFTFGPFALAVGPRELRRNGQLVELSPQNFHVLLMLVESRPNAVRKQDIFDRVWGDTAVGDASLTMALTAIRKALGDDPKSPSYIRTSHKYGYAFIGSVDVSGPVEDANAKPRVWLSLNGQDHHLAPGQTVIGRNPALRIWIASTAVSWNHARVTLGDGVAAIEDLGSTNGTLVNNLRVTARQMLNHGDTIVLGDATLRFGSTSLKKAKTRVIAR